MEAIGYLMIQIFILLLMAEAFGKIMNRIGMPDIIGYILAGIVFVNLCIYTDVGAELNFDVNLVFADSSHFLNVMGQLGLVFLLFGIGLETKLSDLMDIGKNALVIAVVGIIFPFIGGFLLYFLFGSDTSAAIMLGTTIFAMSTVVSVKLLQLLGITDSRLGRTVIGIAIFSDIICLILLAVNTAIVNPLSEGSIVADIVIILVFIILVFLFIAHTSKRRKHIRDLFDRLDVTIDISHRDLFTIGVVLCLGFAAASYVVGLSGIVGAFLAGMYFAEFEKTTHIREKFETLTKFL
ncbi:MAG: cation:proton antiporter, partial [Candidatus Methanomethylophilus sp.]|nr:cation:proton antiporter [Methanomethylophilus sp.]